MVSPLPFHNTHKPLADPPAEPDEPPARVVPAAGPVIIDDTSVRSTTAPSYAGWNNVSSIAVKKRPPPGGLPAARPAVQPAAPPPVAPGPKHSVGVDIPPPPFVSPAFGDRGVATTPEEAHAAAVYELYRNYYASLSDAAAAELHRRFDEKFLILADRFPEWRLHPPAHSSPLEYKHVMYENYAKQITVHANTVYYKFFLIIIFVGTQIGLTKAGLNMTGYAERQINKLDRYNQALVELGSKYYSTGGGEYPIEMRLACIMVVQTIIAVAAVALKKYIPVNGVEDLLSNMVDNYMCPAPPAGGASVPTGTAAAATVDTSGLDAQGLPIVPGTENDIAAVDGTGAPAAAASATAPPPRVSPGASTFDLGGILNGLSGMVSGSPADMAKLVGTAMSFLSPKTATSPSPVSPSPTATTSPKATPARRMSPPRKAPVFST